MTVEHEGLRDWHRLFGLLLKDFLSGSPFVVDVERDLSVQQPFLGEGPQGQFMLLAVGVDLASKFAPGWCKIVGTVQPRGR